MEAKFDLNQGWGTLDEAIDFFLNLCLELTALKKQPDTPSNPFVHVSIGEEDLTDEQLDKVKITLDFL